MKPNSNSQKARIPKGIRKAPMVEFMTLQNLKYEKHKPYTKKEFTLTDLVKLWETNNLLVRSNDGQRIFSPDDLSDTIKNSKIILGGGTQKDYSNFLPNKIWNYFQNLGQGFSTTFIGRNMVPVVWNDPPPGGAKNEKGKRTNAVFILDPTKIYIDVGTVFDGNSNTRIAHTDLGNKNRYNPNINYFSQVPTAADIFKSVNGNDIPLDPPSYPLNSDPPDPIDGVYSTYSANYGGNLANNINPIFKNNVYTNSILETINKVKPAFENLFANDRSNECTDGIIDTNSESLVEKYISNNLASGVESEVISYQKTPSHNYKFNLEDILGVLVISDQNETDAPPPTLRKNLIDAWKNTTGAPLAIVEDAENNSLKNTLFARSDNPNKPCLSDFTVDTWLNLHKSKKSGTRLLENLPVFGVYGFTLPKVGLTTEGNSVLGKEWLAYFGPDGSGKYDPPKLKKENFFRIQ